MLTICVLTAWVGMGFGLTLSAFARSEDQAASFLPLILPPQLFFAGAVVTTKDMGAPVQLLSHLVAAQWGFACAAVLQARLRPSFEDTWWQQARQRWERRSAQRCQRQGAAAAL